LDCRNSSHATQMPGKKKLQVYNMPIRYDRLKTPQSLQKNYTQNTQLAQFKCIAAGRCMLALCDLPLYHLRWYNNISSLASLRSPQASTQVFCFKAQVFLPCPFLKFVFHFPIFFLGV
jgi:hypothetical protein